MTTTPPLNPLTLFAPVLPQTPPPLTSLSDDRPNRSVTPTSPTSPSVAAIQLVRMNAISPPTPAPSPQPFGNHGRFPAPNWSPTQRTLELDPALGDDHLVQAIRDQFAVMSLATRQRLLTCLINDSTPSSLSPLLPLITPRLKRDFLKTLPLELAFHVLSFVDDVRTLARASGVSRFWRALLEDEGTWKRMCWKSGFGDAEGEVVAGISAGQKIRSLEFGEREEEDGTPAGRERRGTLDRHSLQEFAARAELFGLRPQLETSNEDMEVEADKPVVETSSWRRLNPVTSSSWAGTWSAISAEEEDGAEGGLGLGPSSFRGLSDLVASTSALPFRQTHATESMIVDAASPTLQQRRLGITRDAEWGRGRFLRYSTEDPLSVDGDTSPSTSPTRHSSSNPASPRLLSASLPASGYASAPNSSPALGNSSTRKPFSYKTHFKRAYLTESNWLRGPGRLLSTQMSADDGVVTSLGFDGEWVVVGMATSKVHIFEAATGTYVKTLEGHDLGVWCLTLVSKGGGPREEDKKGKGRDWEDEVNMAKRAATPPPKPARQAPASTVRRDSRAFTNDSPVASSQFFRHPRHDAPATDEPTSPNRPRRKSFHAFGTTGGAALNPSGARTGGMGLGAGGETSDSSQQAGVCGTARGYGQKGAIVVSGGCDRDVRVWDVESGTCRHVLRGHTSTVRCMRVIDGRPIAVSGSRDTTLRVWNIETGRPMHLLAGHEHSVRCIEVSGNKVVSGSYDATCRLWDVDTGECLFVFRGHVHQIYAVAFDGIRVVTGSLDSTVRIWSATTGEFLALLQGHTSLVGQLQLDPVSNVLVTGGSDGRVIVFSLETFETIHRLCAHDNSVTCLQFDDRFIVTGGNDGRIKLWDFKTGHFIRELADPCEAVWRVTFRDDKCVILCRRDRKTLMDVRTFRPSEIELHGAGE